MHRLAVLALAAALVAPTAAAAGEGAAKTEAVLHVGERAPGFFLWTVGGAKRERIVLDNWFESEGTKAVVISFFATWCGPCKKELPLLDTLYRKYGEQGLKVVVVSIDREPEAVKGLTDFVKKLGLSYPVVSDRFNLLARRYLGTTSSLPSLFITDGKGRIRTIRQSYGDDAAAFLEGEIRAALGLDAPGAVVPAKASADGQVIPAKADVEAK